MKFINLSGKDVVVRKNHGSIRLTAQSHDYFSVEKRIERLNEMDGVPVTSIRYRTNGKLPRPKVGTIYIVPRVVASRNPSRRDLFIPDGVIEKDENQIVCKALALY